MKELRLLPIPLFILIIEGCTSMNRVIPLWSPPGEVSRSGFSRPIDGAITSGFGMRTLLGETRQHKGVDFGGSWLFTPVFAASGGFVILSQWSDSFGRWIKIDHKNGYKTLYAHLSWRHVDKGDEVERGDLIGRLGDSGRSTGPHLHFEIHNGDAPVNPAPLLP